MTHFFINLYSLKYPIGVSGIIKQRRDKSPFPVSSAPLCKPCTCHRNRFREIGIRTEETIVDVSERILRHNLSIKNVCRILSLRLIFQIHFCAISDKLIKLYGIFYPVTIMHISIVRRSILSSKSISSLMNDLFVASRFKFSEEK